MDSSIQNVKDALRKLSAALFDLPNKDARGVVESTMENLRLMVDFSLDTDDLRDIENLASAIFDQNNGLLHFLDTRGLDDGNEAPQKSVDKKERKKGFEILQNVLSKLSNERLLDQESLIKSTLNVCLHAFRSEKAFEECIEPIIIVLQACKVKNEQLSDSTHDNDTVKPTNRSEILLASDGMDLFDSLAKSFFRGTQNIGVGIKRQKLRALGIISECFPHIMDGECVDVKGKRSHVLLNIFEAQLNASADDKKEQQVLTGCLEGLQCALDVERFATDMRKKSGALKKIYLCICGALSGLAKGEMSRYHLPLAAFELFSKHAELFRNFVVDESDLQSCVEMCKMYLEGCRHHNKDVSTKALKAYEAWLGCARVGLVGHKEVLSQICQQFQLLLESDAKARCLSLRGFGSFASAIKSVEGLHYLNNLWVQLAAYMESVLGCGDDVNREEVTLQLPSLIIAFADIIMELPQVSQEKIELLEKLLEAMFKSFPSLIRSRRFACYQAWFFLLFTLEQKGAALHHLLERSVLKNLVTSIEPSDLDGVAAPGMPVELNQRPQPCVAYSELWTSLLTENHSAWIARRGHTLAGNKADIIAMEVFERLFVAITKILSKLDLNVDVEEPIQNAEGEPVKEDSEAIEKMDIDMEQMSIRASPQASGMNGRERPRCARDMEFFLNLVELSQLLMKGLQPNPRYFEPCYFMFCKCMIEKSTCYPLLSGFFKLLTSAMKIISGGKFLKGVDVQHKLGCGRSEAVLCCELVSKFARDVVARCEQFFQDLLAACLEFVLSLPDEIRTLEIQVPALTAALRMGISHSSMAEVAFNCLEGLIKNDRDNLRPRLPSVLPLLDAYLVRHAESEDTSAGQVLSAEQRNRRVAAMLKKKTKNSSQQNQFTNKRDIALRAVRLLGQLGPDNLWLCEADKNDQILSFDSTLNIVKAKFGLQATSAIILDSVLPRTVHLAENSTDRQCKVSACELLHALLICTIGEHAKCISSSRGQRTKELKQYDSLFQYLLPAVFRLAVDGEIVASRLFEPLALQIVRWFASNQYFEREAEVVLDVILRCVESPQDGKLRESAATWLSEYVKWTLKGMTTEDIQEEAKIIKQLLRRLYGLMNHPSVCKRLGSYSAILMLSSSLRPFAKVIDQFLLEIFHHMILSLRYVSADDPALNSERAAVSALNGLESILNRTKYLEMLNVPRKGKGMRRVFDTLHSFVDFLFHNIGSTEKPVRRYCRQLFVRLSTKVTGVSDPLTWIQKFHPKKDLSIYFNCESICCPARGLNLNYLSYLLSACDVGEWLLEKRFEKPSTLFAEAGGIMSSVRSFLHKADEASGPLENTDSRRIYVREKSQCIYAILKLVATFLVDGGEPKILVDQIADKALFKVMVLSILYPSHLGLDVSTDPVVAVEIPRQAGRLCLALKKNVPSRSVELQETLGLVIQEHQKLDLGSFQLDSSPMDFYEMLRMFNGYRLLTSHGIDHSFEKHARSILKDLAKMRIRELTHTKREAAESMLKFSLQVLRTSSSPQSVWSEVFSDIKGDEWRDSSAWIFYENFRDQLDDYLAHKFECSKDLREIIFRKAIKTEMGCVILGNLMESKVKKFIQRRDDEIDMEPLNLVCEGSGLMRAYLDNFDFVDRMIESGEGPHVFRKKQLLDIMAKIIVLASHIAFDLASHQQKICNAFVAILEYLHDGNLESEDFELFLHSLRILPAIANSAPTEAAKSILPGTSRLLDKVLPLSSSKLSKSDDKFTIFRKTFEALMETIRRSRKVHLVIQLLRQHLFVDKNHIFIEEIMMAVNDFVLALDASEAYSCVSEILSSVEQKSHGLDPASLQIQRTIVNNLGMVALIRLKMLNRQRASEIFVSCCQFLVDSIKECILENLADISKMICVLQILMTFYKILDYNTEIKTAAHASYQPAESEKKMHMTQLVLKHLTKIRKDPKAHEPSALKKATSDLRDEVQRALREFHQSIQNTLLTVILRTQEKISFVEMAFKDCAWNQIVDTKLEIKMEVQPQFRKNIDALARFRSRMSVRAQGQGLGLQSTQLNESYATLGTSSLEIGELSSQFGARAASGAVDSSRAVSMDEASLDDIVLDTDELNDNSTMRFFMCMLDRIYEKKFHIPDSTGSIPVWMKELQMSLEYEHPETRRPNEFNIRLFVAKILINGSQRHPDLFRQYAAHFFRAFFDKVNGIAVLASKRGETLGKIQGSFNSHLRDLCILWGSWILPEGATVPAFVLEDSPNSAYNIDNAWSFIHTLMKITPHAETAVAKSNVQFLAVFVEQWRKTARNEDIAACMKIIRDFVSLSVSKHQEESAESCKLVEICNLIGIQLLNLYIIQELVELERPVPTHGYNRISAIDLRSLFDLLLNKFVVVGSSSNKENRKYRAKKLLKPASQVCGHILTCVESFAPSLGVDSEYQVMCEALKDKVRSLKSSQLDQALFAASSAVSSNPSLADHFVSMAKENLSKLHGDFQYMVQGILIEHIYCLCKRHSSQVDQNARGKSKKVNVVKTEEEDTAVVDGAKEQALQLWSDIAYVIPKLLEKLDEKMQLLTLRLFTGRDDDARPRLGDARGGLLAFISAEELCREVPNFLEILNQNYPDHRSEACRYQFYHLLMDLCNIWPSQSSVCGKSRDDLYRFLVTGLTDPSERIQNVVLKWWHSQGLSKDPTCRLLELLRRKRPSDGVDYDWVGSSAWLLLSACTQSLDEVLFDRPLQDSAIFRDMRISTKSSVGSMSLAPMFAGSLQVNSQYVPQSVRSSQTQGTFQADGILQTQFFEDSSQTQGFNAVSYLDNQTQLAGNDLFISRRLDGALSHSHDGIFKRPLPRKRVTDVSQNSQKTHFARRNEEINAMKQRSKIERANRVELIRRYRVGEVPDIQIKREDVMKPLQRLVLLDSDVATSVFLQLVHSLHTNKESPSGAPHPASSVIANDDAMDGPTAEIKQELISVLRLARTESADVINALLGIAQSYRIHLPASAIAAAGDRSMNFFKCIQTLEIQAKPPPAQKQPDAGRGRKRPLAHQSDRQVKSEAMADVDWFQLSKMYYNLEEHDIVRGLYEKFSNLSMTREALNFELKGDFASAMDSYVKLRKLEDEQNWEDGKAPSPLEVDLWDKGIKDCLRGLQSWDDLQKWIRDEHEICGSLCDSGCCEIWDPPQRKDLDLYFRCLIGNAARESSADRTDENTAAGTELAKIVYDVLFDSSGSFNIRKDVLENDFISEAALGLTLDTRHLKTSELRYQIVRTGRELIQKGYDKFLRTWSSSGSISAVTKRGLLRTVQQLIEMEEFFTLLQKPSVEAGRDMVSTWTSRMPKRQLDDDNSWLHILNCRLALAQKLRCRALFPSDTAMAPVLDNAVTASFLKLSSLARRRGNFSVASYWQDRAERFSLKGSDVKVAISSLKLHRSMMIDNKTRCIKNALAAIQGIDPRLVSEPNIDGARLLTLQGDILGMSPRDATNACEKYKAAVQMVDGLKKSAQDSEFAESYKKVASVYLKYANFCNGELDGKSTSERSKYSEAFVESLLSAIGGGSVEARAHFPRVLEVLPDCPKCKSIFVSHSSSIPLLTVLQWLPQLFAEICRARKPLKAGSKAIDVETVTPLLKRMAHDFPQAVYFAYRVVRSELESNPEDNQFLLSTMGFDINKSKLLEQFCCSLQHLQQPEQQLDDFLKGTDQNQEVYNEVYRDCLTQNNPALGQYRLQFAKDVAKFSVLEALGKDGILNKKADFAAIRGKVKPITDKKLQLNQQQLLHLSTVLGNYEGCSQLGEGLVIPGQRYDSTSTLTEDEAVRIASFDPMLMVMSSLRKPKRLIMRGSDGRDYWWLVKGGEDLRQDERVQQVFQSMNLVLSRDARCSQLRLSLAAYHVIPVSKRAGIIEWVRNTKPLIDVIEDQVEKAAIDNAKNKYAQMYKNGLSDYQAAIQSAKDKSKLEDRVNRFTDASQAIPQQTLRAAILRLASNSKVEFEMRSSFAQSLATISTCHYIMGIGDRHTSNVLIFEQTGGMLGIDFGHAFGSATQLLPVPELMPFRLTPQLLGVLQPLDSEGLLKRTMTHVLTALRTNKHLLRQTMKIFITDPTVDWMMHAKMQYKEQGSDEVKLKWLTTAKEKALDSKFEGTRPAVILLEELNNSQVPWIKKESAPGVNSGLKRIVAGAENERIRDPDRNLEPKEQVDALVELATAPEILCHTWVGWSPYL